MGGYYKGGREVSPLEYTYGIPATINDRDCLKLAEGTVVKLFGEEGLSLMTKLTGGEDMSEYMNIVPGVLAFVGARNPQKGAYYPHHHGMFNIDEYSLEIGTALYAQYAIDFLNKK